MKQSLLLAFVLIATRGAALAQSLPSPAEVHAAVINFNEAVLKTNEAQKDLGDLERKFAPTEAHLKALNDEVERLKNDLNASGDKLSETERALRIQSLEEKNKQLQREVEDYRNDSGAESQQVFQTVAQKLYSFLQQYAQSHGYGLVIERGASDSPIVWYAANSMDITKDVAQAYNAQSAAVTRDSPKKQDIPAHGTGQPPRD